MTSQFHLSLVKVGFKLVTSKQPFAVVAPNNLKKTIFLRQQILVFEVLSFTNFTMHCFILVVSMKI